MKTILRIIATAVVLALVAGMACAQSYPTKPVKIVVPFVAGGATDVVARLLAQKLTEAWGQTVVVDNRAGAGGNIGADVVAKSAPDGYTLLMTSGSIVTANPYIYKSMPFDAAKDLVPVTNVAAGPQVIVVGPNVAARDLRELIAMAKAAPGRVNYGSAGIGTQTHLAFENFLYSAGVDMTHVPYKGEAAAINDLMGGQIQAATPNLGAAINFIKDGRLRALAVTGKERSPQLPGVPSASETLPGFENTGWFGLMAPAGTPRDVIEKVYRDSAKVLRSDEFRAQLAKQGMEPVGNSPEDFGAAIREESARWAKVVKERGLAQN